MRVSISVKRKFCHAILVFMAFGLAGKTMQLPTDIDEDYLLMTGLSTGRPAAMSEPAVRKYLSHSIKDSDATQVASLSRLITNLSRRYSLSPWLILAVIKVESRFQPWAVSPKGALGLMQIMPETGNWLSGLSQIEWKGPMSLFEPETNVTLGIRYLAFLRDRYRGDVKAFLSAYNAGPSHFEKMVVLGKGYQIEYYQKIRAIAKATGLSSAALSNEFGVL